MRKSIHLSIFIRSSRHLTSNIIMKLNGFRLVKFLKIGTANWHFRGQNTVLLELTSAEKTQVRQASKAKTKDGNAHTIRLTLFFFLIQIKKLKFSMALPFTYVSFTKYLVFFCRCPNKETGFEGNFLTFVLAQPGRDPPSTAFSSKPISATSSFISIISSQFPAFVLSPVSWNFLSNFRQNACYL